MIAGDAAGIYIPAARLWLDGLRGRPHGFVSHAHSDHVGPHETVYATAATGDLIADRFRHRGQRIALSYRESVRIGDARVTLYPAGHVLGSAQVLIDDGQTRLLYSGDIRLRPSPACEPAEVPQADILIVEATFGRPAWVFPPAETIEREIAMFVDRTFAAGATPVLLAYSLGKAQEAIALLERLHVPVAVAETVRAVNAVYRRHGVALRECLPLKPPLPPGTAVVCPPQTRKSALFAALGPTRTAILTGWALDRHARYRYGCNAGFPLSDHCGFDDLLRYVELTGARQVYTVYGYAREFAGALRERGYEAYALGQEFQLALPGLLA